MAAAAADNKNGAATNDKCAQPAARERRQGDGNDQRNPISAG